jgi:hypothetical protein
VRWSDSARTSHLSFSPEWQVVPGSHLWRENQRTSPCPWFGFKAELVRTTAVPCVGLASMEPRQDPASSIRA